MNQEIKSIIIDYQNTYKKIFNEMMTSLNILFMRELFSMKLNGKQCGIFGEKEEYSYSLHGMGCRYKYKEITIDGDFAHNEYKCKIDVGFISRYIKDNQIKISLTNENIYDTVLKECEKATLNGEMKKLSYNTFEFETTKDLIDIITPC